MCRVVSARLKKFNVDQDRRGPRHYDDSDFLPHRHKAPTLAKKAGPEPQEKQPGQPPPLKTYRPLYPCFPDLQLACLRGTKIVGTCHARGKSISNKCGRFLMRYARNAEV